MTRHARSLLAAQRGAAATEFAILMIMFVPMVLYAMYFQDAVYHHLEVQEAVISTVWDYTTQSFPREDTSGRGSGDFHDTSQGERGLELVGSGKSPKGIVTGQNRYQFADHTSAFTDEGQLTGNGFYGDGTGNEMKHHNQPFAHACWGNGEGATRNFPVEKNPADYQSVKKAAQLSCARDADVGTSNYLLDWTLYLRAFHLGPMMGGPGATEGGMVTCWAKGWLTNYVIPNAVMNPLSKKAGEFTKVWYYGPNSMTPQYGQNVHDNNAQWDNPNPDVLLKDRAAILTDSWAISDTDKTDGYRRRIGQSKDADQAFYQRAKLLFTGNYRYYLAANKTRQFANRASSLKLANVRYMLMPFQVPFLDSLFIKRPINEPMNPMPMNMSLLGIQNPLALQMATANSQVSSGAVGGDYSNGGSISDYLVNDFYTSANWDKDKDLYNKRGKFYLGATSAGGSPP